MERKGTERHASSVLIDRTRFLDIVIAGTQQP